MKYASSSILACLVLAVTFARPAHADSRCPDEPERCQRHAAVAPGVACARITSVAVAAAPRASAPRTPAAHVAPPPHVAARTAPRASHPASPGMGMLLKITTGALDEIPMSSGSGTILS